MATAIWRWQEKWRRLRSGSGLYPTDYRWGPLVEDEEGHEEAVPSQWLGLLPSLSTLFCWVIGGVLPRFHSPEVPGDSVQGAFQVTLKFSVHLELTAEGTGTLLSSFLEIGF